MKLFITDLDNTLYDWITYYSTAFKLMVNELSLLIDKSDEQLLREFKSVHQYYGNVEHTLALLELPSVKGHFGSISMDDLIYKLDKPIRTFENAQNANLKLYNKVSDTLAYLKANGFLIIGYTESRSENVHYRIKKLGLQDYFTCVYALKNRCTTPDECAALIRPVPEEQKKPNARLLKEICSAEGVLPRDAWYVGDSLTKDILMAKDAGVKSIWARYGTNYCRDLWDLIARVTHWTDEDVERERELRSRCDKITPDYIIDSFDEILDVLSLRKQVE